MRIPHSGRLPFFFTFIICSVLVAGFSAQSSAQTPAQGQSGSPGRGPQGRPGQGQPGGPGQGMRTTDSVRRLPTIRQAAVSHRHTEHTFNWSATAGTPGTMAQRGVLAEVHQFQPRHSRPLADTPVRERDPQIGPDDLVIVALDAQGAEVSWQRIKDPRIVRAEIPDAAGRLSGQTLYRTDAELTVTVPDDVAAVSLDLYEPVRSGSTLALRSLARVVLR